VACFQISQKNVLDELIADFQEAQCFLLLTVQVVTLVAVSTSQNLLVLTSIAQSQVNQKYAQLIGGMSICLIAFTWLLMWSLGKGVTIYFMALAFLGGVVSLATLSVTRRGLSVFNDWESGLKETNVARISTNYESCGEWQPPTFYCGTLAGTEALPEGEFDIFADLDAFNLVLLILSVIFVFAFLFAACLWLYVGFFCPAWTREPEPGSLEAIARSPEHEEKETRQLQILWMTFGLLATLASCICILVFLEIFRRRGYISPEWSVGQAIALTIWAPVIIRLGYLTIRMYLSLLPDGLSLAGSLTQGCADESFR